MYFRHDVWSLVLREEYDLFIAFQNKESGLNKWVVTGDWRKMLHEQLHDV